MLVVSSDRWAQGWDLEGYLHISPGTWRHYPAAGLEARLIRYMTSRSEGNYGRNRLLTVARGGLGQAGTRRSYALHAGPGSPNSPGCTLSTRERRRSLVVS